MKTSDVITFFRGISCLSSTFHIKLAINDDDDDCLLPQSSIKIIIFVLPGDFQTQFNYLITNNNWDFNI